MATQREFNTKRYDEETNLVAETARSLQKTFPSMSWNRAIQIAEYEVAGRYVNIPNQNKHEKTT